LSPGFESLYACVSDCKQISHRLRLLHDNLLYNLDIADLVVEDIDDLDVLDVRDYIFSIVEIFHVVPEALIILLPDGLQGLCC
jgi:uncharacterized Rmd1/YagE family protein